MRGEIGEQSGGNGEGGMEVREMGMYEKISRKRILGTTRAVSYFHLHSPIILESSSQGKDISIAGIQGGSN